MQSGGELLVLLVLLGLIGAGTITVCSCILHVYVDAAGKSKDATQSSTKEIVGGFYGAGNSVFTGNAIVYTFGYNTLLHIFVQIGAIVGLALNPAPPPPTMSML